MFSILKDKSQTAELWEKLNFGNKDQNVKFRKLMGIKVSMNMAIYLTNIGLIPPVNLESTTLIFLTPNLKLIWCLYRERMRLKLPNQLTMKVWRLFKSRRRCLGTLMFSTRWHGLRHTPREEWASASPPHSPVEWILSSAKHRPSLPLIWSYRTTNSSPALKLEDAACMDVALNL